MFTIRPAVPEDAAALAAIYAPFVRDTTVSFEYTPPDAKEFADRIRTISAHYPYFVCCDESGAPVGYAYAHTFRERAAYDKDVEVSVYVDPARHRTGAGRLLYTALEEALRAGGFVHLYACITSPNPTSIAFHTALGYRYLATFPAAGYKFDRWLDIIWMDKRLSETR